MCHWDRLPDYLRQKETRVGRKRVIETEVIERWTDCYGRYWDYESMGFCGLLTGPMVCPLCGKEIELGR